MRWPYKVALSVVLSAVGCLVIVIVRRVVGDKDPVTEIKLARDDYVERQQKVNASRRSKPWVRGS